MTKTFDERNMEKSRAVCAAMAGAASTGKRVLTDRERQILDMLPRFEDGEYVWFGDEVKADLIYGGGKGKVHAIEFMNFTYILKDHLSKPIAQDSFVTRVKRPVQSVFDADGVEIKAGDTVWRKGKPTEYKVATVTDGVVYLTYKTSNGDNSVTTIFARKLTHTRPDSWELWEQDLRRGETCEEACDELIRRAKALAGVER